MSSLAELSAGQRGRVVAINLDPGNRQRLIEMGLTKGTAFEVVRFAPLGDPVELKVRGYHLSLRKHEAESIEVELQ